MRAVVTANLILRFVLELCALVSLGYWGATRGFGPWVDALIAAGAPVLAAVLWGLFASPRAVERGAPSWARWPTEIAVFLAATGGLLAADQPVAAAALAGLYGFNRALLVAWKDHHTKAFDYR